MTTTTATAISGGVYTGKSSKKKKTKSYTKNSINPLSDARRVQINDDGDSDKIELTAHSHSRGRKRSRNEALDSNSIKNTLSDSIQFPGKEKGPILTKADLKARELWHKKSGAGYHLFVQYYASQPLGVVSDQDSNNTSEANVKGCKNSDMENNKCATQGKGQSRAAMKRKKKKMKQMSFSAFPLSGNSEESKVRKTKLVKPDGDSILVESESSQRNKDSFIPRKSHANMSLELQHAIQQQKIDCQHIQTFLSSLSQELPLTFRIRQHQRKDKDMKILKDFEQALSEKFQHLIEPVSYDPSQKIYQAVQGSGVVKSTLSKLSPELKALIVESSTNGLIARQELGSMLPVLALNALNSLKYGAKVLDMCSSPGSKTLQALEIVASNPTDDGTCKPGRLVANDIHPLRLQSLKDAVSRSGLPSRLTDRIVYTNHDASMFPTPKSGKLFDCIIADVPCSGDGTIRKDFRVLSGWMPSIGNSLHSVQKKILMRAMRLVKVGGVIAYSTCSLNPVEDEAVIASALLWANTGDNDHNKKSSFELLEWPSHLLPTLIRSKGVSAWNIADFSEVVETNQVGKTVHVPTEDVSKLSWFDSFDDAKESNMIHAAKSMWPSIEVSRMQLDRCVRLRPQSHDSGGFFVALLRRLK